MALTKTEQQRLIDLEQNINQVKTLVSNAASDKALTQLLILFQEEYRKMDERLTPLEAKVDQLLEESDRLQ